MRKTNIVIFSSGISEKNGTLNKVIEGLKAKEYDVFCWRDLFKDAHESTNIALLPMLIKKIPTFDFAILIGESHDATTLLRKGNKVQVNSMRDNVVFEIGLSVMALGLKRVILLTDQSVRLPEDLTGLHGELAIKHIIWDNIDDTIDSIDKHITTNKELSCSLFDDISTYINNQKNEVSPVVIGASTSAAIGYTTNFILRLLENIHRGFWSQNQFYNLYICILSYLRAMMTTAMGFVPQRRMTCKRVFSKKQEYVLLVLNIDKQITVFTFMTILPL